MPTESILVATGVCIVFLVFAFVLAWADHTTSQWLSGRARAEQADPSPRKEAA